ncbi:MAG: o-succinylbenzoate synthase [Leucobacter sp.]|nr:o-succinylbenzoate synthase [Leucobacter sp.]
MPSTSRNAANSDVAAPWWPTLSELLERVHIVSLATRTQFRGIRTREAALFEGPNGASEFSPFLEYADGEAAAWLAAAIEYGWGTLPPLRRSRVEVNATVPAVAAGEVADVLARFEGCTTAKVKVAEKGQSLDDDIARVRAVRELMGDNALVRIDANGGWSVDEAERALTALAEFDLDYAEQPCMSIDELVVVRRRLTITSGASSTSDTGNSASVSSAASADRPTPLVRIAADESVRKASDPLAVARSGAADLLIVKAQPLGGITRAIDIIAAAGLPAVVSSALDTSVGIGMGLHLAAALPEASVDSPLGPGVGLAGACGLGTVALLDGDVTNESLLPQHGGITVRRPTLDPNKLAHNQATSDRQQWWRDRIRRCYALLVAGATP